VILLKLHTRHGVLFYYITVCTVCAFFYSICIMRYCGDVSDNLGPSALINFIWPIKAMYIWL